MPLREIVSASELWQQLIEGDEGPLYNNVMRSACGIHVPFAIGGSQAMSIYVGRLRRSKDLDLYTKPENSDALVAMLHQMGFSDYYETKPYDRRWIYRAVKDDNIVDIIWSMANQRTQVDDGWLSRGMQVDIEGCRLRLIPLEEMLWSKLYVLQRDRCDWPDILNLLDAAHARLDWRHLLNRLEEDKPLLSALLHIYSWLRPDSAKRIPPWVWLELGPHQGPYDFEQTKHRANLLDTRSWFLSADKPPATTSENPVGQASTPARLPAGLSDLASAKLEAAAEEGDRQVAPE